MLVVQKVGFFVLKRSVFKPRSQRSNPKKDPRSPNREIVRKLPKFVPSSDSSHFRHFLEYFSVRWSRIFFPIAALRPCFEYASFEYKEAYSNLSVLGNNCNGIRGKLDSLSSTLKHFNSPSCITLQESKLTTINLEIPGYQLFFKNWDMGWGGLLITAINENLPSIQVSNSEEKNPHCTS